MADVLVTGIKIGDMPLKGTVSGNEKLPTGDVGDLAVTPNQIKDFTIQEGNLVNQEQLDDAIESVEQISSGLAGRVQTLEQTSSGLAGRVQTLEDNTSNIDNTSDLDKPVSNATQTALDEKADKDKVVSSLNGQTGAVTLDQSDLVDVGGDFTAIPIFQNVPKLTKPDGSSIPEIDSQIQPLVNSLAVHRQGLTPTFDQDYAASIGGYPLNARIMLDNGDIARSTVANNTDNPNVDMTGWVKVNSASQIIDENGLSQQEWNNGVESIASLRTLKPSSKSRVYVKQHTSNLKGSGWFEWDSSSTKNDDNGVYIKVDDIATGRWVRQFSVLNTDDFGLNLRIDDVTSVIQYLSTEFKDTKKIWNKGSYTVLNCTISSSWEFEEGCVITATLGATDNMFIVGKNTVLNKPNIVVKTTANPQSGQYGNGFRCGTFFQPNDINVYVSNVKIIDANITLDHKYNRPCGIMCLGNVYDVDIIRPTITGRGFGVIMHWGGDVNQEGMSEHNTFVTYSYHPHDIRLISPKINSHSDADNRDGVWGRIQTAIILSAVYDVTIENVSTWGAGCSLFCFNGDVHNVVSVARDKDLVFTGIVIDGVYIQNPNLTTDALIDIHGYTGVKRHASLPINVLDDRYNCDIKAVNINIDAPRETDTNNMIYLYGLKGCEFDINLNGAQPAGVWARLEMLDSCKVNLVGASTKGVSIKGCQDSEISVASKYLKSSTPDVDCNGILIGRTIMSGSIDKDYTSGSTSIAFKAIVTTNIFNGSYLCKNGKPVAMLNRGGFYTTDTDLFVTLLTTPLTESISTTDTITIQRFNSGTKLNGVVSGFGVNVRGVDMYGEIINIRSKKPYINHVLTTGLMDNVSLSGDFSHLGYNRSSTSLQNIRIDSSVVRSLNISDCLFDVASQNSKVSNLIYIETTDHKGVVVKNCKSSTIGVAINSKLSTTQENNNQLQVYSNIFNGNPTLLNVPTGSYIGLTYVGYTRDSNPPSSGFWKVGDRIYRESVVVGQPQGWICTAGGSSPVWTPMANL